MKHGGKENTKYREAAERIYRPLMKHGNEHADMRVPSYGGVYPTENGAFVEIQVWVPAQALDWRE